MCLMVQWWIQTSNVGGDNGPLASHSLSALLRVHYFCVQNCFNIVQQVEGPIAAPSPSGSTIFNIMCSNDLQAAMHLFCVCIIYNVF